MEREGKAGGGRVSISSSCVVCLCVRVTGYVSTICIQFVFGQKCGNKIAETKKNSEKVTTNCDTKNR
jgi:hypothetical protein